MRKLILAATLAALPLSAAFATDFTATDGNFVTNDFSYNVSNGVTLEHDESTTAIAVGAVADKGAFSYSGHSDGGGITKCGDTQAGVDGKANYVDVTEPAGCSGTPDPAAEEAAEEEAVT